MQGRSTTSLVDSLNHLLPPTIQKKDETKSAPFTFSLWMKKIKIPLLLTLTRHEALNLWLAGE